MQGLFRKTEYLVALHICQVRYGEVVLLGDNLREIIFNNFHNNFFFYFSVQSRLVSGTEIGAFGKICIAFILGWAIVSNKIHIPNGNLSCCNRTAILRECCWC